MFTWGIIGTGNIARTVAEEITEGGHRIGGVFSRSSGRAESFAADFGAVRYPDLGELLRSSVDGMYIAAPHAAHYAALLECIAGGKPTLCEKAFTVNAAQAKRVAESARTAGVCVAEGMWTRFQPVIREVRAAIAGGAIGRVTDAEVNFCLGISDRTGLPVRLFRPEDAGGALLDLGVYCVSFCQMLFGKPDSVDCRMELSGGIDLGEEIRLRFGDTECRIRSSFTAPRAVSAVLNGTDGRAEIPEFVSPVRAVLSGSGPAVFEGDKGYRFEFDAFAADVRRGEKECGLMPLADTVSVLEVLDECRRQNAFRYPDALEAL